MTTLTRAEIVEALSRELDLPKNLSVDFLEAALEEMTQSLQSKGVLKVSSFGSFNVRQKSKRVGRNPKTGEEAIITPRRVLSFKPSQYLKDAIVRKLAS